MSDLQRLRRYKLQEGDGEPDSDLAELIADIHWAADRIERLIVDQGQYEEEIERLRGALELAKDYLVGEAWIAADLALTEGEAGK